MKPSALLLGVLVLASCNPEKQLTAEEIAERESMAKWHQKMADMEKSRRKSIESGRDLSLFEVDLVEEADEKPRLRIKNNSKHRVLGLVVTVIDAQEQSLNNAAAQHIKRGPVDRSDESFDLTLASSLDAGKEVTIAYLVPDGRIPPKQLFLRVTEVFDVEGKKWER
jgi:hypothetical protein